MRDFEKGATRSDLGNKIQYEGFMSPLTTRRYGEYMRQHQTQEDGKKRASDNWQKGIPDESYMDSILRHMVDVWGIHRKAWLLSEDGCDFEDVLCALKFNVDGLLHETVKKRLEKDRVGKLPSVVHIDHATGPDRASSSVLPILSLSDLGKESPHRSETEARMRIAETEAMIKKMERDFKAGIEAHKKEEMDRRVRKIDEEASRLWSWLIPGPDEEQKTLGSESEAGGSDLALIPYCPICHTKMDYFPSIARHMCEVHGLPVSVEFYVLRKEGTEQGFRKHCLPRCSNYDLGVCQSVSLKNYKKLQCSACKHYINPIGKPAYGGCKAGKFLTKADPLVGKCEKFERKDEE